MTYLKTIRQFFGLSQQELADYLAVNRSLLSMIESGQRNLSTQGLIKLSRLEAAMQAQATASPLAVASEQEAQAREVLKKYGADCEQRALAARRKLEGLAESYTQALHALQYIETILPTLDEAPEAESDRKWLQTWQEEALKKMARSGKSAQLLLEIQIKALEYEAKMINQ